MEPLKEKSIVLKSVPQPQVFPDAQQVELLDETLQLRLDRVLARMKASGHDYLVIYADKEHGANFEYLTGFIPRFEEALLVLAASGKAFLLLGNENMKMSQHARIANQAICIPHFSLPNQPMDNPMTLAQALKDTGIHHASSVGIVGWKMFTSPTENNEQIFDLPYFMMNAIQRVVSPQAQICNATHLFIGGDSGARVINSANEIAHYEYGANLASTCMLQAMNAIELNKTEKEIGHYLTADGQPNNVVTIAAFGQRFKNARLYPGENRITVSDRASLTTSYKGGLSSRGGYVAHDQHDLPPDQQDYLNAVAKPYYRAVVAWLEYIAIGVTGDDIYQRIETVLPKAQYGWHLNPGHLVADEEWMSSPIYSGSQAKIHSGMLLQIDIIPSVAGYAGASAEECVAIANTELREQIACEYPQVWQRIQQRRAYIIEHLNIALGEDILPLSNLVGYLRPYLLNKDMSLCCE